jgi:hypothetical protein
LHMASPSFQPAHSKTCALTPKVLREALEALATGGSDAGSTELATASRDAASKARVRVRRAILPDSLRELWQDAVS